MGRALLGLAGLLAASFGNAQYVTDVAATGAGPSVVVLNPLTNQVYVANTGGTTVTAINGATNALSTIATGMTPSAIAVNPVTNKIYVAFSGEGDVEVIDVATNATAVVGVGTTPQAIVVNPVTNKVYVANYGSGNVTVIDGVTNFTSTVVVGTNPAAIAVNPVTNQVYVANSGSGSVTVIDGATNVPTPVTVGGFPIAVAVNPVTNQVYVANNAGTNVTVIDGATNATTPVTVGSNPVALAVNPVTNKIYVANNGGTTVTVIDGATNSTTPVSAGTAPFAVTVDPTTNKIYVANNGSSNLTVIDGATNAATTVNVGNGPVALAVNPVTDRIYAANSTDGTVSVIDGSANATATVTAGSTPQGVAVNPVSNTIYVANSGGTSVTLINGATNAATPITVGTTPLGVAVNPLTDEIYVANSGSSSVTVINGATNATTPVTVGANPTQVSVNAVTNKIYVADAAGATVIDGATNATTPIALGFAPSAILANPGNNKIYAANSSGNSVTVIDGVTGATVPVLVGTAPAALALDSVTGKLYVMNSGSSDVTVIDALTNAATNVNTAAQQDGIAVNPATNTIYVSSYSNGSVTVINGATLATATVMVGTHPMGVDVDPATNRIYVANNGGASVTVIDGATNSTAPAPVAAGTGPSGVAVNPATGRVYVTNTGSGNVTVIAEQTVQAVPLSASITPLAGNTTASSVPTFTFGATSTFSPTAPAPQGVFYQVDTWQGPWTAATGSGSSFSGTLAQLVPGFHLLYAYADDSQAATSTELDSTLVGAITAYGFVVTAPDAHFSVSAPTPATAGTAISVVVTALDAYDNPLPGYSGTVKITSSDPAASLPAAATLTNGVGTFPFTFNTAGTQTITATDTLSATVTGTSQPINVLGIAPTIAVAPVPESANTGANAAFWAAATGTEPITYQWSFNGAPIAGATSPLLLLTNLKASNAGSYSVAITDAKGTVTSGAAALTVNASTAPNLFAFTQQPMSQTVADGSTVVFNAQTGGNSYQWFCNGLVIAGATDSIYVNRGVTPANDGTYTCLVVDSVGAVLSSGATLNVVPSSNPGRLINLSSRADVGTGASELIVGFVVGGLGTSGDDTVLVRASGPALAQFGVGATLPDPDLTLDGQSGPIATNAGWAGNAQIAAAAASVGAFPWPSASSHDAALLESLGTGPYTAQVVPASGDSGVALAEIYDTTAPNSYTLASPRLINISARAQVGTAGNILIAGFVIGGNTSKSVLIRASGPALAPFGVPGTLPDPVIRLYNSSGVLLQSDANWGGDAQIALAAASVGAFSWGTFATPDSALLLTLPPGSYTAQVAGNNNDTGVALVEVYELP